MPALASEPPAPPSEHLDQILGLQLAVAWAGETSEEPARLGWWKADLTDELAGGDLFARLVPKTAQWAGLELARECARRTDEAARLQLADPDAACTLFHFGFEVDEALQDRLESHKRHGRRPAEVFGEAWSITNAWNKQAFAAFLESAPKVQVEETPAGRWIKKLPAQPLLAAQALAAALSPLPDRYPLPYGAMPAKG